MRVPLPEKRGHVIAGRIGDAATLQHHRDQRAAGRVVVARLALIFGGGALFG
jgi:hypothetical protein